MHPYILYRVAKSKGKGESVPVSDIFAAVFSALLSFSALHIFSERDKMTQAESHQPMMEVQEVHNPPHSQLMRKCSTTLVRGRKIKFC